MLLNNFVIHNIFIFDNLKFHAGLKHEKKKSFVDRDKLTAADVKLSSA